MDCNRLIGVKGDLPWRLPADLRFFKRTTLGHPLLMGRRTWESLPRKPLPGRRNIVLTRQPGFGAEGAEVVSGLGDALRLVANDDELMVIGGAQVYAACLAGAERLYLTEVEGDFEGDTWFPALDAGEWRELHAERHEADERNPHAMRFVTLQRVAAVGPPSSPGCGAGAGPATANQSGEQ